MEQTTAYTSPVLVHWTYSKDEWKAFQRWNILKKGLLHYVWHWIKPSGNKPIPQIRITHEQVWTNELPEPFHDGDSRFRKIDIHDAGDMNVMAISYEKNGSSNEIRIPIPKGKLREAIDVQERILQGR